MNKVIKGNVSGRFFVSGSGFVADKATDATKFSEVEANETQACLAKAGLEASTVVGLTKSWAVNYIRQTDIVFTPEGKPVVQPNDRNPSRRRFATKDEAIQHGSRFGVRRANRGDKAGTAGHIGFYVTESDDSVNAVINWKTGLTNPVA